MWKNAYCVSGNKRIQPHVVQHCNYVRCAHPGQVPWESMPQHPSETLPRTLVRALTKPAFYRVRDCRIRL